MPEKMLKGFAVMTPEQRRLIASKGGKALASDQRAFSKDRGLASAAGKAGGLASQSDGWARKKRPQVRNLAKRKGHPLLSVRAAPTAGRAMTPPYGIVGQKRARPARSGPREAQKNAADVSAPNPPLPLLLAR
jgi:general stress protein YciG